MRAVGDVRDILKYFDGLMVLVYAGVGVLILGWGATLFNIDSTYRVPLGVFLIAYGLVRGYRVYQKYF